MWIVSSFRVVPLLSFLQQSSRHAWFVQNFNIRPIYRANFLLMQVLRVERAARQTLLLLLFLMVLLLLFLFLIITSITIQLFCTTHNISGLYLFNSTIPELFSNLLLVKTVGVLFNDFYLIIRINRNVSLIFNGILATLAIGSWLWFILEINGKMLLLLLLLLLLLNILLLIIILSIKCVFTIS